MSSAEKEVNPVPEHGWTCFHCGDHFTATFAGQQAARLHFGDHPIEEPTCRINAKQFRAMQDLVRMWEDESAPIQREMARMRSEHAQALIREEEKGYARGLDDARKYPETLGLARAS